jgi:predicted ATPase
MTNSITPVRVFISSPGDLFPERAVVRAVLDELNHSPVFRDHFKLIPYAWEAGTPPVVGALAQDTVNDYLLHPADADILICLFWLRMGSPLQQVDPASNQPYQSGTEYEFLTAYRAHQAGGRPIILLYRCVRPPPEAASIDYEQAARVEAFFNRFESSGDLQGLTGTFDHADSLRNKLRYDLSLLLQRDFAARAGANAARHARARLQHTLPIPPTALIGREHEVTTLCGLLLRPDMHLLTLTGPGGIGKTHLALQVAADLVNAPGLACERVAPQHDSIRTPSGDNAFLDGACFVDLAPLSNPTPVIPTIMQTLDLKESGSRPPLEQLQDFVQDKQLLLLLDNVEQVADAALDIAKLLATAPQLKVLVTSRVALHLRGEQVFAVPPLALPDPRQLPPPEAVSQYPAVALFVRRAQDVRSDFQITGANAPTIAKICYRLDGLPLAIELAAARSKQFPPEMLLARLNRRLKMLIGGARDMPERQQTLRNTIDWSYNLLDPGEQLLFARLSVFVGGCALKDAEAVCILEGEEELDVATGIESLLDKSLLRLEEQLDGDPRITMLETIREYASEQLEAWREGEILRRQHAMYYLALTEMAEQELIGSRQMLWLERLEQEHDNLRAAIQWALDRNDVEVAARLGGALWRFWYVHGHISEGRQWLNQALKENDQLSDTVRAKALLGLGGLALMQGDYNPATVALDESVKVYQKLDDKRSAATALNALGVVEVEQGHYDQATTLYDQSLRLRQAIGDRWGIALSFNNLAFIAAEQGNYSQAVEYHQRSLPLRRELADDQGIAMSLSSLGDVLTHLGDNEQAITYLEEGLTLYQTLGDKRGVANTLSNIGLLLYYQGNIARAATRFLESLVLFVEHGLQQGIVECLEKLAWVSEKQERGERAARLGGAAEVLREATNIFLPFDMRREHEQMIAGVLAHLGNQAFARAWADGREMTQSQVVAYALDEKH